MSLFSAGGGGGGAGAEAETDNETPLLSWKAHSGCAALVQGCGWWQWRLAPSVRAHRQREAWGVPLRNSCHPSHPTPPQVDRGRPVPPRRRLRRPHAPRLRGQRRRRGAVGRRRGLGSAPEPRPEARGAGPGPPLVRDLLAPLRGHLPVDLLEGRHVPGERRGLRGGCGREGVRRAPLRGCEAREGPGPRELRRQRRQRRCGDDQREAEPGSACLAVVASRHLRSFRDVMCCQSALNPRDAQGACASSTPGHRRAASSPSSERTRRRAAGAR